MVEGRDNIADPAQLPPALDAVAVAARRTAIVAALFCLVFAVLLWRNNEAARTTMLTQAGDLAALKRDLGDHRTDEALKTRIREADQRLRAAYFRHQQRANHGAVILLVGAAVVVAAWRVAASRRPTAPAFGDGEPALLATRVMAQAQTGVSVAALLFVGLAVGAFVFRGVAFTPEQVAALYAVRPDPVAAPTLPTPEDFRKNWHRFRGPDGTGVAVATRAPTTWNLATRQHVRWQAQSTLPGKSSPILWDDQLFVTGGDAKRQEINAFDVNTGRLRWRVAVRLASGVPRPEVMADTGYAASTPVTDGQRVYAIFADGQVAAVGLDGREVWTISLGVPQNLYGHASSLALWHDLLSVQFDQGDDASAERSRLFALRTATGAIAWEVARAVVNSWSTPLLIATAEGEQVITTATPWVIAYRPATGDELWRANCLSGELTPSATFANGLVVVAALGGVGAAIKPDGTGDVTETKLVWKTPDNLPDVASPLADAERVYLVSNTTVTCLRLTDGQQLWQQDLGEMIWASPLLVGDTIYLPGREGTMFMFRAADRYEAVGQVKMGESCHASPVCVAGRLYLRTDANLYCIADD